MANAAALNGYGTAVLYDAARRLQLEVGLRSVMPVARGRRFAAPAVTVRFSPPEQARAASGLNFYDIIAEAPKGSALVVQAGADRWVCGGNITRFAELSGLAGFVTDGCVRDIASVRERDFPIYARGVSVAGYAAALVLAAVGEPVLCGDVAVGSGDVVVGDEDGVVCLPTARLSEIIHEAADIAALDARLGADIEAGRPLAELHASRVRWPLRRSPENETQRTAQGQSQ